MIKRWLIYYWHCTPFTWVKPCGWGAAWESVWRRWRRCIICGRWFGRLGWWNPFVGVNVIEEHCSRKCADQDLEDCERMFPSDE